MALVSGILFGLGLTLAGMTQPAKVTGFLDVAGAWDPSLAFVMVGAIAVHAVTRRLVARRGKPFGAAAFDDPTLRAIDVRLVAGAAIFGAGWGVTGYCPGPAIVALGTGSVPAIAFVGSAAVGMQVYRWVSTRSSSRVDAARPDLGVGSPAPCSDC
jgi:uncharacterized membrane protein YedE/YeeE